MKKTYSMLQILFVLIAGVSFTIGITGNPSFNIFDFFMGLSTEIIGWILGVTVFQFFYDAKLSSRRKPSQTAEHPASVADELLKCKSLLDSGAITEEEFERLKTGLLARGTGVSV